MSDNPVDAIVAALEAGDPATAEELCRITLDRMPDATDVLVLLALSLWRKGDHAEALGIYARLTELHPDDALHWSNYATVLWQSGDLPAAEAAFRLAVEHSPGDANLLEQWGLVQLEQGKPMDARVTLLRAFGKAPDSPSIRIHAAHACSECRDSRAEALLRPWRQWLPLDDQLQSELAEVQAQQGEAMAAVELVEDLAQRLPMERHLRLRLASLYERVNRLADAEALLAELEAEGVAAGSQESRELAHQRAQLAVRHRDHAHARVLLEAAGPRHAHDYAHWFALAGVCDRLGDAGSAMHALERAHAGQVTELGRVAPHLLEADAELLPNVNAPVSAADYANWPRLRTPDASQSPVFVVGFPRSGTTLLEQMLDAHPRLQSMDERPFFNMLSTELENTTGLQIPQDIGKLGQRDCDELRKGYLILACAKVPRRWDARLVDKNPLNMLWLPLIHRMFPEARIVLALRHPCDVLLSCYMQNFRTAVLASACRSLEHLASAYVAAMQSWLHHVDVFKPSVFISRYEDLVADAPTQAQRIATFLQLEDAESMLHFDQRAREKGYIKTPSYTQVIEPINTRGIGRWLRYRPWFERALPILEPMLRHWGYAVDPDVQAVAPE